VDRPADTMSIIQEREDGSPISYFGGVFPTPRYLYAEGYKRAADLLVEHAQNGIEMDGRPLVLPILFLYRHFVELELKNLLEDCECLYRLLDKSNDTIGKLTHRKSKKLNHEHDLEKLLCWLKEDLSLVMAKPPSCRLIERNIIKLHKLDSNSQAFRYWKKKDGSPFFPEKQPINLMVVKEQMRLVKDRLYFVGAEIETKKDPATGLVLNPSISDLIKKRSKNR